MNLATLAASPRRRSQPSTLRNRVLAFIRHATPVSLQACRPLQSGGSASGANALAGWLALGLAFGLIFAGPLTSQAQALSWGQNVGATGAAGTSSYDAPSQTYTLTGAGAGLGGAADAFHFAYYQAVCGDGSLVVRLGRADASAQAAVVLRASLDPGAPSAAATIGGGAAQFVRRSAAGGGSAVSGALAVSVPCWLKVVRQGDQVSAYASPDRQTWTALGSDTVPLGASTFYIGLAVSNGVSDGSAGTAAANFDGLLGTFLPGEDLALWLKADAGLSQDASGRIRAWADQSGGSHDVFQANASQQPSLAAAAVNGWPALHFDGAGKCLQVPDVMGGAAAGELFVVLRATDPARRHSFLNFTTNYVSLSIYPATDGHLYESFGSTTFYDLGLPLTDVTQFHLYNATSAPGQWSARLNGQPQFTAAGNTVGFPSAPSIGYSDNYAGTYFAGDIAEVLVYRRALEPDERAAVEAYLNGKYAYNAPPAAPVQLSVTPLSATQVLLAWSEASSNVSGYTVERLNPDGTWSVAATLGAGAASYLDASLTPGTAYSYRVTAANATGNSPVSATASGAISAAGSGGALPANGLQLWLRADAGVSADASGAVSAWTDLIGGAAVTQGNAACRPTLVGGDLNGLPALRFDGASDYLDTNYLSPSGPEMTLFVVARGANYQSLLRFQPPGSGSYLIYPWYSYQTFISSSDGGTGAGLACGLVPGQWNIGAATYQAGGTVATYRNGSLVASRAAGAASLPGGMPLEIGRYAGGGEYAQADVAEVLIYNRALGDAERQAVESYLNGRYAVVAPPGAPAGLTGGAVSATQLDLFWQPSALGATALGFSVERRPADGSAPFAEVAAIAGGQVGSFIDEALTPGASYVYRVRASNAAGESAYSPEATLTLANAGGPLASLPAVGDLRLWLRSEAGVAMDASGRVSAWADASGHGNDAQALLPGGQPLWVAGALNGQPALRFDGQANSLATALPVLASGQDATVLAVVGLPDASRHGPFVKNGLRAGFALGVGGGTLDGTGNDALGIFDYVRWLSPGSSWGVGGVLAELCLDPAGNPSMYRNGKLLGSLGGGGPAPSTGPTFIGGYHYDTARYFGGDVAEVLMFDRRLTDAERQAWEQYLNAKYQFSPPPPAPTQLAATALSATQASLAWVDSFADVAGYRVERQNPDGTWSLVTALGPGSSSYVVSGLAAGTPYTFRVTAYNGTGDSPVAAVTLTTPAGGTALPVGDLRLWLRADSGTVTDANGLVSQWLDRSGNGLSAAQASPGNEPAVAAGALNGLPTVRFDGSSSFLNLPGNVMTGLGTAEVFVVLRAADPTTGVQRGFWRFSDASFAEYPWSDGNVYDTFGTNGQYGFSPGAAPLNQFNLYNVAAATGEWTARLNGQVLRSSTANVVSFSAGAYTLGQDRDGRRFAGDVAELLIFDRTLGDAERHAVEQYLAGKYALASAPSAPSNLETRALSPTQVSLAWQYPTAGTSSQFAIERAAAGTNSYQAIATVDNATSFIDNNASAGTAYSYEVVATDLAGNVSAASNAAAATTPPVGAALPMAGLRLWLAADAGATAVLDDWVDQSGNGNDAQQGSAGSQPSVVPNVLNGRPVARFNGQSVLQMPASVCGGLTAAEMFVVLRAADPLTARSGAWRFNDQSNSFYPFGDNGAIYETFGSSTQYGPIASPAPLNQFNLYNVSAAPGAWTMRMNEQVLFSASGNVPNFSAGAYLLGQNHDGYRFTGDLAEVLIFDHALGDADRLAVEAYLAGKYGLASAPSAPTALSVRALSPGQVSLTWAYPPGSGTTQFTVERAPADTNAYQIVAVVNNATSYLDATAAAGTAYSYKVVATDLAGNVSADSSAAQASTPASGPALPTAGLRVWLQGDAGAASGNLASWVDQSGYGNNAQEGSPGHQPQVVGNVLNGQPVVHFDGGDVLQLPPGVLAGATAAEMFAVMRAADPLTARSGAWRFNDQGNSFYPLGDNGAIYETFGSGTQYGPIASSAPLDQFNLYNVSAAASGNWTMRMNEQVLFNTSGNVPNFSAGACLLGQNRDGYGFKGDFAEVLIFDHALTDSDRLAVERYLAGKYALAALPAAPTALTVRALSPTQTNLVWQYPLSDKAVQFTIERAVAGTGNYQVLAVVNNATSFIDSTAVAGAAYSYQIVATDLAGNVSPSSTAAQAVTPLNGTPLPTVGLRVWLQADAGTTGTKVASWVDQSGNGNDAQQGSPGSQPAMVPDILNGQPVVRFNGGSSLQLPGNPLAGATAGELFVILRAADLPAGRRGTWRFNDQGNSFYPFDNGAIYETFGSDTEHGPIASPASLNQFNLYNVSADVNAWTMRMNEQVLFHTATNTSNFSAGAYLLGQNRDGYGFAGDLAEVLIFDHALTDSDRLAVEQYLAGKYGLASAPPAPTNLSAHALGSTQVSLNWQYPEANEATQFTVERALAGGGGYQAVGTVNDGTTYVDASASANTAYSYQVRATDLAGNVSAACAPASVSTPISGVTMPTTGLRLWLKADAGTTGTTVASWVDQSGLGNDAQQGSSSSQPTIAAGALNGQPVVHFDGGDSLQMPASLFEGVKGAEMFVVIRAADLPAGRRGTWRFNDQGNSFYPFDNGAIYETFGSDTEHGPIVSPVSLSQFNLYNVSADVNAWTLRINEQVLFHTASNAPSFSAGAYLLGQNRDGYGFKGDMAELLIFDHVLSAAEHDRVAWYLAAKYLLAKYDLTGDGLTTAQKQALGLDPFKTGTNGDGLTDGTAVQLGLNPMVSGGFNYTTPPNPHGGGNPPPADPNDHTPPVITLTAPINAVRLP